MKWNSAGRGLKALGVSLAVGLGMTACSRDYTVAYLYATSATRTTNGVINAYAVDYQTGAISQLADSPIPSGGSNPVTLAAAPNGKNLYVINHDTSTVVQFSIGTDGKLYSQNTYNVVQNTGKTVIGTNPTSLSIDPSGTLLYVAFTYQNGFTPARPGPGGVAIYPINADGSLALPLGSATNLPYIAVGDNPVGIFVGANVALSATQAQTYQQINYVYVIDDEVPANGSPFGVLLTYQVAIPKGFTSTATSPFVAINQVVGPVLGGVSAGLQPSAIAVDPLGKFIYVTDAAANQLYGYANVGGTPTAILSSPFATGNDPLGVTVDPRGEYVYVVNFGSNTVSSYAIAANTGSLSTTASGSVSTDASPTCVAIEPALGIYLYTSNRVDSTISAGQLSPNTGIITGVQQSPFTAQALPTCLVAVANGAHASQIVN